MKQMHVLEPLHLLLVLSRFSTGLFRAMFAMKEIENGKKTEEFRRDAVSMALTSDVPMASQIERETPILYGNFSVRPVSLI